jgi:hypothetical protein
MGLEGRDMSQPRFAVLLVAVAAFASPGGAQTSSGETVVIPSLPGVPNREVRIGGQELAGAEPAGPEVSFTGRVIQWEEGRSITMKFADETTRVVPVASNIIFPPDLRPGGLLTVTARPTADGLYKVTGLSTAMPPPRAAAATTATASAAPTATAASVPAATPVAMPERPAEGPKGKAIFRASFLTLRGTLKAIDAHTVTLVESSGTERSVKIAEKAVVAEGLAAGDEIVARVPLQKPFDGRTADRVERPGPPKTPRPSKFREAESPKN